MSHEPSLIGGAGKAGSLAAVRPQPIVPPVGRARLRRDIAGLPANQALVSHGGLEVYVATAAQIPGVLREIGRLREVTFRAVGEGTGQAIDLDEFDRTYRHLFIWHTEDQEVVGAYRLGHVDHLIAEHGIAGLYTSSLFRFDPRLFEQLGTAIELGRSFVQAKYQRLPVGLFLLWKGIGAYIAAHPRYHTLIGPVSISNDYHPTSRALMARFLRDHRRHPVLADLLEARTPFELDQLASETPAEDLSGLESQVDAIEGRKRSLPTLLKEYLRLGGQLLELNVDPLFGDALDAMLVVDLRRTRKRLLERYMGNDEAARFVAVAGHIEA